VIATGTPEGVGPLSDGDEIEIEVEGVGTLEHSVRIPDRRAVLDPLSIRFSTRSESAGMERFSARSRNGPV